MKSKKLNRLISAILAVIMIITVMPTSVFAADTSDMKSQIAENAEVGSQNGGNSVPGTGSVVVADENHNSSANVNLPEELNNTFETTVGDIIMTEDGFRIQMNSDMQSYCIISYIGSAKHVVIPEAYNGVPITRIGDSAFFRKGVEKVTISESIVSMGIDVFFECENLAYNVYEGGRYLGSAANPYYYFVGPESKDVTDIVLHTGTRIIAAYAFRSCYNLKSVSVPGENVIQMGYGMVFDCPAIESLTIPYVGEKMNSTRNAHFGYIFGSRTYGGNISYVPESLRTLVINGGSIAKSALYGVDMLESITIPEVAGGYFSYMFGGESYKDNIAPTSIKNVTVLGGEIQRCAFYKCVGLENIVISDAVLSIGYAAFQHCDSLTSITIPFVGATKDGTTYTHFGYIFGAQSAISNSQYVPTSLRTVIIIGGASISASAFNGCSSLVSVEIPASVTSIGESAFNGCSGLESLVLPFIGDKVYSATDTNQYPFGYIFGYGSYEGGIATEQTIYSSNGIGTVNRYYIPASLKSVTITGSFINNGAFKNCNSLTSVKILDSVTSIGYSAFENCSGLTGIEIPDSVTSIGNSAFQNCSGLTSIEIPDSVTSIGGYAFYGCSSLTSVTIGNGVTSIGYWAFQNCSGLTSIEIPDSVTSIGYWAFKGCTSLTIYCIVASQPSGWNSNWNPDNRPVVWGYNPNSSGTMLSFSATSRTFFAPFSADDETENNDRESTLSSNASTQLVSNTANEGSEDPAQISTAENDATSYFSSSVDAYSSENSDDMTEGFEIVFLSATFDLGSDGLSYTLNSDGESYSVSVGTCTDSEIVIPATYNNKPVTIISEYAFWSCSSLTSISIPDSVISIEEGAFQGCENLTSITIPDSVTSINGSYVFYGCTGLENVSIGNGIKSFYSGVFSDCTNLVSITIPFVGRTKDETSSTFDKYFNFIFGGSVPSSLKSVTITGGTIIDDYAFSYCNSITSISIPDSVTKIGAYAFYGCSSLVNINIPDRVTSLGDYAFCYCGSLLNIVIPASITSIGNYAFCGCNSLTSIEISDSVIATIGGYAFSNCRGLSNVIIGNGVTRIGASALEGCESLTSITLPFVGTTKNTTSYAYLGAIFGAKSYDKSFEYVPASLKTVIISGECRIYDNAFYGCSELTNIELIGNVTSIRDKAFYGCSGLTSITIPDSVTSIGNSAFYGCEDLSSIAIGNGVTSIGTSVFNKCGNIMSITVADDNSKYHSYENCIIATESKRLIVGCKNSIIPTDGSVTSIGTYAFSDCYGLENITIPNTVTSIGKSAFEGCSGLTSITIPFVGATKNGTTNKHFGYIFGASYISDNSKYVPTGLKTVIISGGSSIAASAFYGCSGITSIIIPDSVTSIGKSAFQGCSGLTNIRISNRVTNISDFLFYKCISLTCIEIPDGVTSIGNSAFFGCSGLTNIAIPNSVTSIGDSAFYNCCSITNIAIPESVTSIGNFAFYGCSGLTSIEIPNNVTNIGDSSFSNCNNITSIMVADGNPKYHSNVNCLIETASKMLIAGCKNSVIPSDGSVTSIGNSAFFGCSGLTNIAIPNSVTSIGDSAFYNCCSITSITIPDSMTSIGSYAFESCTGLTSIEIPDSVTSVGDYAFNNCSGFTNITIGRSVLSIPQNAFSGCTTLTTVTMLGGIRRIYSNAFGNCTNLSDIYYNGERNEWRHVIKAGDWDAGAGDYNVHFLKPDSGLLYETDNSLEHFYLSGHAGKNGSAVVPEQYSGRSVVAVLPSAFYGNKTLVTLELSDTITYIGESAFKNCINLKEVNIPAGVSSLEFGVFSGCESLTELKEIPLKEKDYFGYFFGAYSYKDSEAYVPEALKSVTVREGSVISDHAFSNCVYITTILLPDDLGVIGAYAFEKCKSLQSVNIPVGVTEIKEYTFSGCSSLPDVVLPYGITVIGTYAFENCFSLNNGTILPDSVTKINDHAFTGCTGLESFEIPDSVTSVGEMILDGCNYIRTVKLGKGLRLENIADYTEGKSLEDGKHINGNPFLGIDKSRSLLEKYEVAADHAQFMVDQYGVLYYKIDVGEDRIPVAVIDAPAMANLVGYEFPDHIVEICPYAFAYNTTVTSIDLEYVRLIGNHAFYEASGLVYVNFGEPDQKDEAFEEAIQGQRKYSQYIRSSAFMGCTALQSANIGSPMIVGIEELAFADCPLLKTVTLGKNIQLLGLRAFGTTGKVTSGLERFIVDENNTHFKSIDGVLYRYNSDNMLTLVTYPALTPVIENGEVKYSNGKTVYRSEFSVPNGVSAIESYAFETARHLYSLTIDTTNDITIGDYALANSSLRNVTLGANVVSVGLKRGEGEYTVFSGCNYLTSIDVKIGNRYYCSKNGVLFNRDKSVLIKYPVAKAGTVYTLPDTVSAISSMAFKDNDSLACVVIKSAVSVIGLEAFYDCSSLSLIYFDKVYAPTMVMENAFTTYVSVDDTETGISVNPRTKIGYSSGYYENGDNGEVGWKKYENTYPIAQYDNIPNFTVKKTGGYYAVVVVDSNGTRLGNTKVSLTDPNGNTETVEAIGGVATFTDLFGKTGLGFSVDYDNPYSVNVFDNNGEYFTYSNSSFYLDEEMRITYVTLTKSPSAYGVNCGNTDINSQTAEINKSEYGYVYDSITLIDENLGYVDGNIKYDGEHSETIEVSVIGYCDEKSGWSFDSSKCALYQNGTFVCGVSRTEKMDGAVLFTFNVPVKSLAPETAIEARLVATKDGEADATCSTALNIHVFEFSLTADDVDINTDTLSLDLQRGGEIFTQLFGSPSLNVNIGKNVAISAETNGSEITLNFSAKSSKKKDKTYGSYKEGYEYVAGSRAHNKNTYLFTFNGTVKDSNGEVHNLVYNIRFARDHETDGYFYYRCYVYEGVRGVNYNNEVQTFYGAVNSKAAVAQGRSGLASKAYLIYIIHLKSAQHAKDMDKIKKLGTDAQYSEAIKGAPHIENSHSLEASLIGDFVFRYDRDTFIQPVSGYIKGELSYTFKHNSQFVVWVIPVVLEVEVNLDGKVELTLKADDWRSISFEEIKMTLSAEIAAQVGVGCSVASVGLYGSVGTVFVLDFYPSFGVESWVLNGEIGAYVKALWWQKKFTFGKWDNVDLLAAVQGETQQLMMSAAYIVDGYSLSEPDDFSEDPRLVVVGDVIYKVYTVNAEKTNATKYDEYNCYKIAIARWNSISCEWESIGLVDDNGFNDMSYAVFASEDSLEIVFTQQTEKIDAEKSDDIYASSANLSVKRAVLTNGSSEITIDTIYQSQTYKYLVCNDIINGVPVVVWAENSDNNMFGVSPQNYIDANGVSHVFETSANSIWMSTFENGVWSQPQCIQSGLSAITGIVIDDNGGIAFIVDENGDLSDLKDRVMYYFDPTTDVISAVNDTEEGSIVNLIRHEGNIAYYYQSVSGESGLCVLDRTNIGTNSIVLENGSLADEFRYIYNADGKTLGILYTQNKTWIEDDGEDKFRCDGAAFYGIFYEDGKWGAPVEISVFEAENGVYISSFDCISSITGDEIIISFDLSDSDGNTIGNDTVIYPVMSRLSVKDCIIDYENKTVSINIINNGAKKTSAFISVDGEIPEKIADNIMSGETVKCVYSLEQYESVMHNIIISDSDGMVVYENDIDLSYSDLVPYVKHILLGQENKILVAVANNGNLANSALVVVRKGNYNDVNLSINDLDERLKNIEIGLGAIVPLKLSEGENAETIWIAKVTVEPGAIAYLEVPVGDDDFTESCIISVSVKPDTESMEKGSAADNNLAYWSYKNNTGVASTLDGNVLSEIPVSVGTNKTRYEFDSSIPADIVISYYCPSVSRIVGIIDSLGNALSESCFTVNTDNAEIIISKDYLLSIEYGEHSFEIVFADDVRTTFAIYSAAYYAVTWRNYDGTIEGETLVMEGKVPSCDVVPAKEPDAENQYVFAGWDIDGDGAADTIPAVKADIVLIAVYTPVKQKYNVTWVLKTGCDSSIRITETYSYGVTPEYKGVMMSPENEVFSSWNAEILPVTENAVYEACYTKNAFGSATISSTSFSTVRGLEFNTTLYLSDVSDMTETVISLRFDSNVAELSAYSCREGVSVISEDGGKLTLAVKNLVADTQIPLIDLTFRTVETVSAGKHSFILIESKDMISDSMATVDIYQNGDISGDGVVNTRDLAMLRQYVVGKIELTDIQLYYANFYDDVDSEGNPRINTRDIALLQQYIIANIG